MSPALWVLTEAFYGFGLAGVVYITAHFCVGWVDWLRPFEG